MSERPWKTGIVGCGKIAGGRDHPRSDGPIVTHAQAYHRHPAFKLAAAVDTDAEQLGRFQRAWGVSHGYGSLEEMQGHESLDVVSICTPDRMHFSQAMQLVTSSARPRVLLIEKPVCLETRELARLAEAAQRADVAVFVNHTRRFDPAHQRIARTIKSNSLGALVQGQCVYYGGWMHNGTHVVDTLRMLFAEEPNVVAAAVSGPGKPGDPDLDVRLTIGGAAVAVEGFDEMRYQLFESELRFQAGRVRLLDFGGVIMVEQVEVNQLGERVLRPAEGSPLKGLDAPMYHAIEAVEAHLQGRAPIPPGRELGVDLVYAAGTMKVIWQASEMAGAGIRDWGVGKNLVFNPDPCPPTPIPYSGDDWR